MPQYTQGKQRNLDLHQVLSPSQPRSTSGRLQVTKQSLAFIAKVGRRVRAK